LKNTASLKITPVILCGGSGTRLWPLSRQHYPKQFLNFFDDKSLFQQCVDRALDLEKNHYQIEEILIVTNESHRFLVLEQVDELQIKVPIRILLEPESKNTAPALTLAALVAQERNQDSILVVTPADHYVKDTVQFTLAIHEAIAEVSDTVIITLGIKPTSPNTGFGYIQYDEGEKRVKDVLKFIEKPKLKIAQKMIHQGSHAWNSGIFVQSKKATWICTLGYLMLLKKLPMIVGFTDPMSLTLRALHPILSIMQ
jgi:mannose-1-phosphate guanylyltransferase / mannose-6-phosphate isomerase